MLTIKQGDTRNAIVARLKKDGEDLNLEGLTVKISITEKVKEAYCTVLTDGRVMFPLEENITNTTGVFLYEFIVIYPDGREETFPNNGYEKLLIKEEVK